MSEKDDIAIIVNAASGGEGLQSKIEEIQSAFQEERLKARIFLVHNGHDIQIKMESIIEDRYKTVVAAGGDGTVSAVASYIINTNIALGIIPIGTLNHLAKDLNIPLAVNESVKVIAKDKILAVDTCVVNGNYFVNNSSIGIYPKIVSDRENRFRRGKVKLLASLLSFFSIFKRHSYMEVELVIKGNPFKRMTTFVFVGNNQYEIEGVHLGGRKSLVNGELCVYVAHRTTRLGLILMGMNALLGFLRLHKDFDAYYTNKVMVDVKKPFIKVALDGEVKVLKTPLVYEVVPKSLQVIVP